MYREKESEKLATLASGFKVMISLRLLENVIYLLKFAGFFCVCCFLSMIVGWSVGRLADWPGRCCLLKQSSAHV